MSEETTKQKAKKSEFILVKNELGHITGTGLRYREKPEEKGQKGQLKTKSLVLFVGWNSVRRDYWDEAIKNKNFAKHVDYKTVVVKDRDVFGLNEEELVAVVSEIFDPRFLKILTKKLENQTGRDLAQKRLDMILNPDYENGDKPLTEKEEFYKK